MPNVGPFELAIVLIIALVVFGPKRLPELGKSVGKGIREFKGSLNGDHDDEDAKPAAEIATPQPPPPPSESAEPAAAAEPAAPAAPAAEAEPAAKADESAVHDRG